MKKTFGKSDNSGFTLIELIIVIAIVGLMAAVAIPNMFGQNPRRNLKDASMALISTMQRAKMEAIKNNVSIGIDFTATGYTVYRDVDGNGTQDGGDVTRWVKTAPPGCSISGAASLGYNSRGLPLNGNIGTVVISSSSGSMSLAMSASGYARLFEN